MMGRFGRCGEVCSILYAVCVSLLSVDVSRIREQGSGGETAPNEISQRHITQIRLD